MCNNDALQKSVQYPRWFTHVAQRWKQSLQPELRNVCARFGYTSSNTENITVITLTWKDIRIDEGIMTCLWSMLSPSFPYTFSFAISSKWNWGFLQSFYIYTDWNLPLKHNLQWIVKLYLLVTRSSECKQRDGGRDGGALPYRMWSDKSVCMMATLGGGGYLPWIIKRWINPS